MLYVVSIAALLFLLYAAWRVFHKKKRPTSAPEWVRFYGRWDH